MTLECETKMIIEGPSVKAVPEDSRRKVRFSKCQNAREAERRHPLEGTPLQQTATWLVPPKDSPVEVGEVEVEDSKFDLEFDAKHAWNPRERVITEMENCLTKRSEEILGSGGVLVLARRCDGYC